MTLNTSSWKVMTLYKLLKASMKGNVSPAKDKNSFKPLIFKALNPAPLKFWTLHTGAHAVTCALVWICSLTPTRNFAHVHVHVWAWGRVLMIFAFEIRWESNPRGSKPPSHTVYGLNHATNQLYTIGTECSHHMWWEHSVPIVFLWCNRIVAPPIAPCRSRVLETGSWFMRVLDPGSVGFRCMYHHARLRLLDYMDR